MRRWPIAIALLALLVSTLPALAQSEVPRENLVIDAARASTWTDGDTNIVQLEGPVTIDLEQTHMTARSAVIWLKPVAGAVLERYRAEIALIGDASVSGGNEVERGGDTLYITGTVRGVIRISANQRRAEDLSKSDLFAQATGLKPVLKPASQPLGTNWLIPNTLPDVPTTGPTTEPFRPNAPVSFEADRVDSVSLKDGTIALMLDGNVKLVQQRPGTELIEMLAERAVLFTPLHNVRELQEGDKFKQIQDAVTGTYLEGDVRIVHTPADRRQGEQRLRAKRVYYDFTTDRAILTDAVIHTVQSTRQIPVIIRAQTVRQLSLQEYRAEHVTLTTSSFATPSYSIGMSEAYVREIDTGDVRYGTETQFVGRNATMRARGWPFFYLPYMSGTMTQKGSALRDIVIKSSSRFGTDFETQWGLFETLGWLPNPDLDISFRADYFGSRGPATGLDSHYQGGFVSDTTKQPWSFKGDFTSFFVEDHGVDDLGRGRANVEPPTNDRFRVYWEHTQVFPNDWEVQLTAGYVSDPTFLEEWFQKDFDTQRPQDTSIYIKHQQQSEAFTLLASVQPNDFVTNADSLQEQFEVERLPELTYHRIGESFGNDNFTLYSDNSFSGLRYRRSGFSIADQGFAPTKRSPPLGFGVGEAPGVPSIGETGTTSQTVYRGDLREEVSFPLTAGEFRVVPYVMGRYTGYTDSPNNSGTQDRLLGGAGLRITTAFWRVDDSVESDLFDLHRLRHVIEPEVHVFASAESGATRDDVFIFDEPVDAISDITGVQLELNQRWQTKRGGPGRWRSVDVFTFNVDASLYSKKPSDSDLTPLNFRGMFFPSEPEASIARNSINADATWRINDATIVLSDAQYNLDSQDLATASIGLAVQRESRVAWYIGTRYVDLLKSNITTVAAHYQLSTKYSLGFSQSYDFGISRNVRSTATVIRTLDRFYMTFSFTYDASSGETSWGFNLIPQDLGNAAVSSDRLKTIFQ